MMTNKTNKTLKWRDPRHPFVYVAKITITNTHKVVRITTHGVGTNDWYHKTTVSVYTPTNKGYKLLRTKPSDKHLDF